MFRIAPLKLSLMNGSDGYKTVLQIIFHSLQTKFKSSLIEDIFILRMVFRF